MEDDYQKFDGFCCPRLMAVTKHGWNIFFLYIDTSVPNCTVLCLQRY